MALQGTIYPNHSDVFDLRNVNGVNYVSAVKNQGLSNFCQTFAVAGAMESRWMIQGNTEIDLSEADAIVCSPHGENNNSSFGATVLNYIIKRGITTEDKFDTSLIYTNGWQCVIHPDRLLSTYTISGYNSFKSVTDIKWQIENIGPVIAPIEIYDDFQAYTGGIYIKNTINPAKLGHVILLVGWNDTEGYWIAKNSWGAAWGEAGFVRIGYGQTNLDNTSYMNWSVKAVSPFVPSGITFPSSFLVISKDNVNGLQYLYSPYAWTASTNAAWCSVQASGDGDGFYSFTTTVNADTCPRFCTITFMANGKTATLLIKQMGTL